MKNLNVKAAETKKESFLRRSFSKVKAMKVFVSLFLISAMAEAYSRMAFATETVTATADAKDAGEKKWDVVIGFITPWIARLGGVIILIGAIEFGLAWKDNDAEGKTKGMRTIIAGCIVTAVGASADLFLL